VLAPSFSDIFSGNAFKNGIATIILPQDAIDRLMEVAKTDEIVVDLDTQTVTTPFQDRFEFTMDPFRRDCLMKGLDEIGLTLAAANDIDAFEAGMAKDRAWL
jgi:3-isopropylmalate/(R)-2-methylmalate dehydratase small subunit